MAELTEKEKRDLGLQYDPDHDPQLLKESYTAKDLCWQINSLSPWDERRRELFLQLLGHAAGEFVIQSPFYCDYGYNISIGKNFYMNHSCIILDGAKVSFGDNALIGPQCGFYTAEHPLEASLRRKSIEMDRPITVGNDVWIGGGAKILAGVTIGDNCIIGAGAVVTRDVPSNTVVAGVPARIVKEISNS